MLIGMVVCLFVYMNAKVLDIFVHILTDKETQLKIVVMIIHIPPMKYYNWLWYWQMLLECYCSNGNQMTPDRALYTIGS